MAGTSAGAKKAWEKRKSEMHLGNLPKDILSKEYFNEQVKRLSRNIESDNSDLSKQSIHERSGG